MPRGLTTLLLALLTTPALAQFSTAPVLAGPPNVNYPPIAKAAHVSGDVTVTFAINPDGTTTSVQLVSGPPMLAGAVVDPIKKWRFKTPIPLNAQTYFEAKYAFRIKTDDDDEEDSLDRPPYIPSGGDVIYIQPGANTVTGDVHSTDGSQIVDVTATAPTKAEDRCPKDKNKQTPDKTDFSDYVELLRYPCAQECTTYRVRVYRNGRVTWRGFDGVIAKGDREAIIDSSAAETLLNNFQTDGFWSACSVPPAPDPKPKPRTSATPDSADEDASTTNDEEAQMGIFLTASIGGFSKTVSYSDLSATLAWRIDRAADTHRWRHPDPATEPYDNMDEDVETPKPGMTLLIRSTHHFNPYTGQQTFTYLDKLLKRGESVNAADASGWTALMYASYLDTVHYDAAQPDPIKLLLDAHADPNIASLHGDTALMFAAYRGTLSQSLLNHGANLNAHNADGVTPLMLLAQLTDPDQLKQALADGADANAHDNLGRTALDYLRAASCGKVIVPLPKSRGLVFTSSALPPCPATTAGFLRKQSLLQQAMKAANGPQQ
jgi:TonB family protein